MEELWIALWGVRDDRGTPIRFDRHAGVSESESRPTSYQWLRQMSPVARCCAGMIVLGPLLILVAMLIAGSKPGGWSSISLGGYLMLILPIGLGMFWRASRLAQARRKVELGYCARCGYVLSDLPTATDGCTVCPECGAAWRLKP